MSSLVTAPGAADSHPDQADLRTRPRPEVTTDALLGAAVAAALSLVAFSSTGGTGLAPNTWLQIGLIALAAGLAVAVLALGAPGPVWGVVTLLLFGALVVLTFASIAWSVQPASSWLEANRTLSYFAAFTAAVALARLVPGRWRALLGGVAAFATVVCAWSLLVKVFPGSLDAGDQLGRLRAPFDYWNATGLAAAIGLPGCLWAAARREGGPVLRTLSVPAQAVLLSVLVLSQSRGAVLAAAIGVGLWIALVPLRLRAVLALAPAAAGAAAVSLWAVGHRALTHDGSALAARTSAGHAFGLVLVVALGLMTIAGAAVALAMDRIAVPPQIRRRIGIALIAAVALLPVLGIVALASSSRGLTGEVSHAWSTLTDQSSVVFDTPGRLAQLGSSRPRYWSEGVKVGEHAALAGTGALGFATARTRYARDPLLVQHAHSYAVETFADFGLIGVAVSLGLLVSWAIAALRVRPTGEPAREHGPEWAGLAALLAVVVIFGVHSAIDWTWFIPGVAVPAMLGAGWLAGRGPLTRSLGPAAPRRSLLDAPGRAAGAVAIVGVAALAAWIVWQPLRSADALAAGTQAMVRGDAAAAISDARSAEASNPVSVDPLWELSALYTAIGQLPAAHRELIDATTRQPSNAATWQMLAQFDIEHHADAEARTALRRARELDPHSAELAQLNSQLGQQG